MARAKYYDKQLKKWVYADNVPITPVTPDFVSDASKGKAADAFAVGTELNKKIDSTGGKVNSDLDLQNHKLINVKKASDSFDAVNYAQLSEAIESLGTVFDLKGSKPTFSALPKDGNMIGDVWYVEDEESGYIWLNKEGVLTWERFGPKIDLSGCLQFDTVYDRNKTVVTDDQGKIAFVDKVKTSTLQFTGGSNEKYDGSQDVSVAIPTELKNPNALTFTGNSIETYDGSSAKTVAIPKVDATSKNAGEAADAAELGKHLEDKNNPHEVTRGQIGAIGNPLKTVTGEVVAVDDVSPLEHSVGCKVSSHNLCDSAKLTDPKNYTYLGRGWSGFVVPVIPGETYTFSVPEIPENDPGGFQVFINSTVDQSINSFDSWTPVYDADRPEFNKQDWIFVANVQTITICISLVEGGEITTLYPLAKVMIAKGNQAFPYVPYIPDLTTVRVSVGDFKTKTRLDYSGNENPNSNYVASEFLPASELSGQKIILHYPADKTPDNSEIVAFYDSSKAFVDYWGFISGDREVKAAEGTAFIRFTMYWHDIYDTYVMYGGKKYYFTDDYSVSKNGEADPIPSASPRMSIVSNTPGALLDVTYRSIESDPVTPYPTLPHSGSGDMIPGTKGQLASSDGAGGLNWCSFVDDGHGNITISIDNKGGTVNV